MKILNGSILYVCIFLLCSFISCSDSSSGNSGPDGELYIKVHDAPADYDQVNVTISIVSIHKTGNQNLNWSIASDKSVTADLLTLRNGNTEELVMNKVSVGSYDKIKLRFGPCTIVENGIEYELNLDSAPQFEKTMDFSFEVEGGKQTQLSFDFDIHRSIRKNGIGLYTLSPVIRIQNTIYCGWISGSVIDTVGSKVSVPSTVYTSTELDSVSTKNEPSTGSFRLSDLPEDFYSILIVPDDTLKYHSIQIDSLLVERQKGTNIGVVVLNRR
ncbi:MAG: DUF4382 domain-containing protein [Bacteroidetes bacterium]|nr:DUF4382 domain-containing protein [Bacteroidota bacterium]